MTKRRYSGVAFLACAVVAWCAVVPAAQAAKPAPVRVLSPRRRTTLAARPQLIRLRIARRARGLRVTLNGHSITRYFSRRRHRVRRLWVSPNHGLRYGRNVLSVSARRGRGRRQLRTVRFRIRDNRPLAAAGFDRVTATGARLRLNGLDSRIHPDQRRLLAKLRYRWSVVRRPGARAGVRAAHRNSPTSPVEPSGSGTEIQLLHPDSPTPSVITTGIGTATLMLTVTAPDGAKGSDLVNVRADPAPEVRIETGAKHGDQSGVALSGPISAFYPGDTSKWLQIVVLDRRTLELVSNKSYDCPQADAATFKPGWPSLDPCVEQVQADLAKLDDPKGSKLVIAVNQPGGDPSVQPPVGVSRALAGYVVGWDWWDNGQPIRRGTFAAVFTPGVPMENLSGRAVQQREAVDPSQPGTGMIDDNLARDNEGNYSLVPGERVLYDTRAQGSTPTRNVIQVGDRRYEASFGGSGGWQVLSLDARTLAGTQWQFNATPTDLEAMSRILRLKVADPHGAASPRRLIFVVSVGDPRPPLTKGIAPIFQSLGQEIAEAGGTRNRLLWALDDRLSKDNSYALLGRSGFGRSNGIEVLGKGAHAGGQSTARLRGALTRTGVHYQFEPADGEVSGGGEGSAVGLDVQDLLQVAGQPPSAWPEQGNPGRTAAIKYIGLKELGTDAPRTQYWTLPYEPARWLTIRAAIGELHVPAGEPFDSADFHWAQWELRREISWMESTHAYVDDLAQPFSDTALRNWARLKDIANEVENSIRPDANALVTAEVESAVDFGLDLGEEIPVAGALIGATDSIYKFATQWGSLGLEPAGGKFHTTVGKVGVQFAERLEKAQALLKRQLPDRIVSDYGRLKTVGSCASPIAEDWKDCPFGLAPLDGTGLDHGHWQYTQDDQAAASRTLLKTSEAAAYSAILPAEYRLYELPAYPTLWASRYMGETFPSICFNPFADLPPSGQVRRPVKPLVRGRNVAHEWQIGALGHLEGSGSVGKPWGMRVPAASLTNHLFGDAEGDLNLNQADFLNRSFDLGQRTARLPHYPWATSHTGWIVHGCHKGVATGAPLAIPRGTTVARAVHRGVPVSFDVPKGGSTARLTLSLGSARPRPVRGRGAQLRNGSVLNTLTLRHLSKGNYRAGLRISRSLARRVRQTKIHRATLRVTLFSTGRRRSVTTRSLRLAH